MFFRILPCCFVFFGEISGTFFRRRVVLSPSIMSSGPAHSRSYTRARAILAAMVRNSKVGVHLAHLAAFANQILI
jgi:hypothetical protein